MSVSTVVLLQAQKQIDAYGKTVTLTRVVQGAYDTATGVAINTSSAESVKAIVEDYKGREIQDSIQVGDKKLTFAAKDFIKPSPLSKVTIDSETFAIVAVQTIYIQSFAALYIVQGRKA